MFIVGGVALMFLPAAAIAAAAAVGRARRWRLAVTRFAVAAAEAVTPTIEAGRLLIGRPCRISTCSMPPMAACLAALRPWR